VDLIGILNGIDEKVWDPSNDPLIPARYSPKRLAGKKICRAALEAEFGLPEDPDVPLIGMIARLTEQKGTKELFAPGTGSVPSICAEMKVRFVIIGTGEKWCEDEIRNLSGKLPNFRGRIGYDEKIAHLIEAGSDFYMMPSRYEPCGLNQMYSLRYGTIPIARRTGGLADSIENYDQETGTGTGFLFDDLTPRSIYDTTGWAVWAYYNRKDHIKSMRLRGMSQDFSWTNSAREYESLYREALSGGLRERRS
jgi:starch synthase